MDSFTQRMMSRATSRKAEFEQHMNDILREDDDIDDPNLGVMLEAKRREYREILHSGGGNMNQVADKMCDAVCENKENTGKSSGISDTTKSRLKQLVPMYTGEGGAEAFPSPVGYGRRQAEKELEEYEARGLPPGKYSQQRSERLAHLATIINNWEDESDKKLPVQPRTEFGSVKPVCKPVSSPALKKKMANFDQPECKGTAKKVAWDDKVIQSLEMQGFQRCESDQHLVFDYKSPQKSPADCSRDASRTGTRDTVRPSPKRHPAPAPPFPARPVSPVRPSCSDEPRFRNDSLTKFHSISPTKCPESPRCSMSPVKLEDGPAKLRPECPVEFRAEAPYRSNSPTKFCPVSPPRPISDSPTRYRSQSPVKFRPDSPTKTVAVTLMHETIPVKKIETATTPKTVAPRPPSPKKFACGSAVLKMAAKYEIESSPSKKVKDPTELSIHDRKAIFEKNNGSAILPKAPFGMPVPAKALQAEVKVHSKSLERPAMKKMDWKREDVGVNGKDCVTQAILDRQKEIEMLRTRWERRREESAVQGGPCAELPPQYRRPPTHNKGVAPPPPPLPQAVTPNKIRMGTRSPVRGENSPNQSPNRSPYSSPTRDHATHQFPAENHYKNQGQSPRKSSEMVGTLAQVKKIKVSPPKAGRLYPSISDIETESEAFETESEVHESDFDVPPHEAQCGYGSDSEESAMSFGRAVVQRARLSQLNLKRSITTSTIRSCSSSSSSTTPDTSAQESRILHEMDNFLDEALGDVSPPKRSRECINILPRQDRAKALQPSGFSGSCHSDIFEFTTPSSKENKTPLVHTVSTYRKIEAQRTPKKELYDMKTEAEEALENETPERALVEERIFELEQEMIKQTTIISQATQALNLCHARVEFVGSMEQVEAEKLLLIATSRRMVALHEVERLKVEKTVKPGGLKSSADKGSLTVEYISLPIKMCPTEPDKTDYFLCLVTSGVQVQATQVLALKKHNLSRGNRLAFNKPITLENLYCDFTVTIEVFRLNCKNGGAIGPAVDYSKEDKKLAKLRLTPQKKGTTRRNNKIPIESPGGPHSVRSPSFKMVGFVVFSLREVKRNKFTLNKVPYGIPLDGTIELSMSSALKSEVEYRGFLTQFEEVSGFGAWKRKWALLKGSTITFWLYPEHEETNKIPIDTVDLSTIKNKEVGLVSREICARPHTILLETDCGERKLLSADTLEDRLAWTKAINKSLQLIHAWGGRSY